LNVQGLLFQLSDYCNFAPCTCWSSFAIIALICADVVLPYISEKNISVSPLSNKAHFETSVFV
jgi:hypothetical protein